MMRATLTLLLLLPLWPAHARGQNPADDKRLPRGAVVVETRHFKVGGRRRALSLWMLRPKREPFRGGPGEPYTCPDETRGSHYRGPTRVSLIDTDAGRIINTVRVTQEYMDGLDEFDIPYRIRRGGPYHVAGVRAGEEGKPAVVRLRDYNGDGEALEFALFDAVACMPLETMLFGYSRRQDRVIQYAFHLEVSGGGQRSAEVWGFMDYIFSRAPVRPGYWNFAIDYRGRGGSLDHHVIRYNRRLERFEGQITRTGGQ